MPNGQVKQSKYWVFTLNNYTDEEEQALLQLPNKKKCKYICFGKEIGESGTIHLQGYVEFSKKKSLGGLRKTLSNRAHYEPRRGTQEEAIVYTKKDGDWKEAGEATKTAQGSRTDLDAIRDGLLAGTLTLDDVAINTPETYCKYRNGLKDIASIASKRRGKNPPRVEIIYGPPGTGKSAYAHSLAKDEEEVWVYPGHGWFDGYIGQRVALFDDFADDFLNKAHRKIDYHMWLRLTDRYPLSVPVKGSTTYWNPEIIVLTTNREPASIYSMMPDYNKEAFMRRVSVKKQFTNEFPWEGLRALRNPTPPPPVEVASPPATPVAVGNNQAPWYCNDDAIWG